jgi:hypothetical protein
MPRLRMMAASRTVEAGHIDVEKDDHEVRSSTLQRSSPEAAVNSLSDVLQNGPVDKQLIGAIVDDQHIGLFVADVPVLLTS